MIPPSLEDLLDADVRNLFPMHLAELMEMKNDLAVGRIHDRIRRCRFGESAEICSKFGD
jgi:hypothetical protein